MLSTRGGVLEDTFWSPWSRMSSPWPWSFQALKNALSSAKDSPIFRLIKNGPRSWPFFFFVWNFTVKLRFSARRPFFFSFLKKRLKSGGKFAIFAPRPFFFGEHFCVVSMVLGLERVCPGKVGPWPRIFFGFLASSLVSLTPPLLSTRFRMC